MNKHQDAPGASRPCTGDRLRTEMAAARRYLASPRTEIDEVLERVAHRLAADIGAAADGENDGAAHGPEIVCVARRERHSAASR